MSPSSPVSTQPVSPSKRTGQEPSGSQLDDSIIRVMDGKGGHRPRWRKVNDGGGGGRTHISADDNNASAGRAGHTRVTEGPELFRCAQRWGHCHYGQCWGGNQEKCGEPRAGQNTRCLDLHLFIS